MFRAAQDSAISRLRSRVAKVLDWHKMPVLDTLVVITKSLSQPTRHPRERLEPEPSDRVAGLYLPEDLVGYTIGAVEIAHRGSGEKGKLVVDARRSYLWNDSKAAMHISNRSDEGRDAIRQAIIKRLLPEWSRTLASMTSRAASALTSRSSDYSRRDRRSLAGHLFPRINTSFYFCHFGVGVMPFCFFVHVSSSNLLFGKY